MHREDPRDPREDWVYGGGGGGRGRGRGRKGHLDKLMALQAMAAGGGEFGPGPFGPGPFGPGAFGLGPFGRHAGSAGRFGGGGGRGRRPRGDVRSALLLALSEEPRNGYQLMQLIEERSGGRWRPSPGSVYPALAQLEDEGLIKSVERDEGKVFEITDAGRAQLEERGAQKPPWEFEDEPGSEPVRELHSLVGQIHLAARQVSLAGDESQVKRATETLAEARRALYRILAEDSPAGGESDTEV